MRLADFLYFIDTGLPPAAAWRASKPATRPLRLHSGRARVLPALIAFTTLACLVAGVFFTRNH